jgi:4-hydroxyphenylpyruvate dioxygenase
MSFSLFRFSFFFFFFITLYYYIKMAPTLNTSTETKSTNLYAGFDHLRFTVTNAKQAASFYCTRLGFKHVAYRGLETGCRDVASHVVKQGDAIFVFESPIQPFTMREMAQEIAQRGDGVKDVSFTVKDCKAVYEVRNKNSNVVRTSL